MSKAQTVHEAEQAAIRREYEARKKLTCYLPKYNPDGTIIEPNPTTGDDEKKEPEATDPKCPKIFEYVPKNTWLNENQRLVDMTRHVIDKEKAVKGGNHVTFQTIETKMKDTLSYQQEIVKKRVRVLSTDKINFETIIAKINDAMRNMETLKLRLKKGLVVYNQCSSIVAECINVRNQRPGPETVREESEESLLEEQELIDTKKKLLYQTIKETEELIQKSLKSKEVLEFEYTEKRKAYDEEFAKLVASLTASSIIHVHDVTAKQLQPRPPPPDNLESFQVCSNYYNQCTAFLVKADKILIDSAHELSGHAQRTDKLLREHIACLKENIREFVKDVENLLKSIVNTDQLITVTRQRLTAFNAAYKSTKSNKEPEPGVDPCEEMEDKEEAGPNSSFSLASIEMKRAEDMKETLEAARNKLEYDITLKRQALWLNSERVMKLRMKFPCLEALYIHGD